MQFQEQPVPPDDTHPTSPNFRPTEPRRPKPARSLPIWALFAIIIIALVSLVATLTLILTTGEPIAQTPIRKHVTVFVGGDVREIDTQVATVGDLLREQGIQLADNDAISTSGETLLSDGMHITINRARNVSLRIDNEERTLETPFTNPQDILTNQNITLNPRDEIWLDGTAAEHSALASWPVPVNEITIEQAIAVTIVDGESQTILETTADTVGDALFEAGIIVYLTDSISPAIGSPLTPNTQITIERARPVTIQVDSISIETRVQGGTVLDALSESGITLIGLDYTIPAETDPITGGMTIYVLRVTEEIISAEETIPYETILQADAALELDQRRTIQAGQNGILRVYERIRYENGVEVGREPSGTEVIQAAQNHIIAYGTQIVVRSLYTPDGAVEYWRRLRVYATSYHPEALGGDNVTAIGMTLQHGVIGANPNIIPYRTQMYVPGYGLGIMADTGGARSSAYWIDLGYSDVDYVSWHQYVDIYLLTPVPENVNYLLPVWQPMNGIPDN
jgi:resuscitation-promoting factor RpfB